MRVLYVNAQTHRRIKALAVHDKRNIGQFIDAHFEKMMRQYTSKQRNEMYARVDEPSVIAGGKPDA